MAFSRQTKNPLGEVFTRIRLEKIENRLNTIEAEIEKHEEAIRKHGLWALAAAKVRAGANLTRHETAAFLCVSTKTVQRLDAEGVIKRCSQLKKVVVYAASDVLRLASATRKES